MGDPKKQKKKFVTPGHPWQKERLEAEKALLGEYSIKNKRQLWKTDSIRKGFNEQVKSMIADESPQSALEKKQLIDRLYNLGLLSDKGADLDQVLGIGLKDLLERRLQTIVYRKHLANSMEQARQFIVHGHIMAGGKKITSPAHITTRAEEAAIGFAPDSPYTDPDHPELNKQAK
jgi:small subunit ribosomal protein S4